MKPFSDATVAIIARSANLVMGAADEIALGLYRQLRRRSAEATGDEASALETQCVANIATFVRDVASNIGARDVRERFSGRLEGFQMHRSTYAVVGDILKPVLKDVLGADATNQLCAAWGDAYWGIASPPSQVA